MIEFLIAGYLVISLGFFACAAFLCIIGWMMTFSSGSPRDYVKLVGFSFLWPLMIVWGIWAGVRNKMEKR